MKKFFNRRTFRILLVPMFLILTAGHFGCVEPEPAAPIVQNPVDTTKKDTTKKDTTKKDTTKPDPYDPYVGTALWKVYRSNVYAISPNHIGSIAFSRKQVWMLATETYAVHFLNLGVAVVFSPGRFTSGNRDMRIAVDEMDNLWYPEKIGTSNSLNRMTEGVVVTPPDFAGIPNTGVIDVIAKGKKVWVSTTTGIAEFNGTSWKKLPTDGWMTRSYLAVGLDGTLWAASGSVLKRLKGTSWETVVDGNISLATAVIAVDSTGSVWYATTGTLLNQYDGKDNWSYDTFGHDITAIAASGGDTVWIGTKQGAYRLGGGYWEKFVESDGLGASVISSIAVDPYGNKWFGWVGTLTRYAGK